VNSQLCNEFATLLNEIEPDDEGEIYLPFIYHYLRILLTLMFIV